jgi:diguanylate cyclase (GGDEF)-like protein
LIALILVARFSPAVAINWPSLLALILFTSVLSILANLISQRDLEQIDRQKQQLARSEAQQSAMALLKSQLLEEAQRRIEQLTVLHEVATVSTQVSTIDQLIACTTTIIGENLFPDNFGVLLMMEEQGILRPHPSYQFKFDHALQLQDIPVGQGVTGQVAQTGQPIRIGNIKTIQNYVDIDQRTASELCVPIKFKEKVLGVINAESTKPEAFSRDDEFLLGTLAGQLAITIEQLRATAAERHWLDQLAHSNELINALAHITTHMQKALTQDEIIQTMGNELKKIGLTCAMAVRDSDQKSFTIKYTSMSNQTLERLEHNLGAPFLGSTFFYENLKATQTADDFLRPAVITQPDRQMQLFFPAWQERARSGNKPGMNAEGETTYLRLPLLFEETLLGILWIWSRYFTEADLSVMSTFAQQVASALKRARLFQEVQSLALTDHLTGLQNRRSLFELGRIEFARSQRMDRPFCCLLLDLDHFKKINDEYGHPVGDLVLQEFAQRCRRSVREVDLIGRYGGEELVIFLPETNSETAMQVAERLRESVAKTPIRISDRELQITVSIGVSRRDENTLELETLIARADQAMYVAKYKGRNRVAIST